MALYEKHKFRRSIQLDGVWNFLPDPQNNGKDAHWECGLPVDASAIVVPGVWNTLPQYEYYEGTMWYQRHIFFPGGNCGFRFEGILHRATVFVDGIQVGEHTVGFTPFQIIIPNLSAGEHLLVIRVSNDTSSVESVPPFRADWFCYGGIFRSVFMWVLPEAWIDTCKITYQLSDTDSAAVKLQVCIGLADGVRPPFRLTVKADQQESSFCIASCPESNHIDFEAHLLIEKIQRWDIDSPNLTVFQLTLERGRKVYDDLICRTGFRTIEAYDGSILLNGHPVYIRGINRHAEHPDWGQAIPPALELRDVDLISSQLFCNAIRGSHYPNSEEVLDYCDEKGVLFWEEIPLWQCKKEQLCDKNFQVNSVQMLKEMILRDLHHPCIILWGLHNECETETAQGEKLTQLLAQNARSFDASRLITFASDRPLSDCCFKYADVISINKYYGWYEGDMHDWAFNIEKWINHFEQNGMENKPIIISEFGCEAISGEDSYSVRKWNEPYQAQLLDFVLPLFQNHPRICGSYIWQFADVRASPRMEMIRPRCYNNKGILDAYRKPKLGARSIQELYRKNSQNDKKQSAE